MFFKYLNLLLVLKYVDSNWQMYAKVTLAHSNFKTVQECHDLNYGEVFTQELSRCLDVKTFRMNP